LQYQAPLRLNARLGKGIGQNGKVNAPQEAVVFMAILKFDLFLASAKERA
jgi:hypothetical protein